MKLRHAIEFKWPKFIDSRISKLTEEEKEKFGSIALVWGGGVLAATVVYLVGYNRGMKKAIDSRGIYIIKGE